MTTEQDDKDITDESDRSQQKQATQISRLALFAGNKNKPNNTEPVQGAQVTEWSDDFDPCRSKNNQNRAWIKTCTICPSMELSLPNKGYDPS
jgi:hypothetical protein